MLPTLSTERLTLVPLTDQHLPFEIELDTNPDVMKYVTGQPRTEDEVLVAHAHRLSLPASSPRGFWVGLLDDKPIGLWMLLPTGTDTEAELGYRLAPEAWHKGFATEGSFAVLRFAFGVLGLRKMRALAAEEHERTRRTLEGLGFRCVGRDGEDVLYEMTADEWRGSRS